MEIQKTDRGKEIEERVWKAIREAFELPEGEKFDPSKKLMDLDSTPNTTWCGYELMILMFCIQDEFSCSIPRKFIPAEDRLSTITEGEILRMMEDCFGETSKVSLR